MVEENVKERRGLNGLFIILGAIIVVIIIIVIVFVVVKKNNENGGDVASEQEIINAISDAYEEGGGESVAAYYNQLIGETKSKEEKIKLLRNSITEMNLVCETSCRSAILENIHKLDELMDGKDMEEMCKYENLYVDSDPIDECASGIELDKEYYDGE